VLVALGISILRASDAGDFAGAVGLDSSEVRARDARVIDDADFHGVGGEADVFAVFPGIFVFPTDREAGVNAEHAFLPGDAVDDAGADTNLFQVVVKGDGDEFAHGAGHVHFTNVAQALAVSGFGDFVALHFEIRLGGLVVEYLAFFVDNFSGGNTPDFVFGFVDFGNLGKEVQRFHAWLQRKRQPAGCPGGSAFCLQSWLFNPVTAAGGCVTRV